MNIKACVLKIKSRYFFALLHFLIGVSLFGQNRSWKSATSNGSLNSISINKLDTNHFKILQLNIETLKQDLVNIPQRGTGHKTNSNIISIPNEKGETEQFQIYEASNFSPELSNKYPDIKSYIGYGLNNKAILRLSISPSGINTMIDYRDKPTVFMQPITGDVNNYIVYNRLSRADNKLPEFVCGMVEDFSKKEQVAKGESSSLRDANDQLLRKFKLAISVNGEYTAYHGGTIAGALAAINTTMTRVNAVFETDMAVTFELVDATQLIYTNAATDPYSAISNWNNELQSTLTTTIGEASYDIGHMFGASGGGGSAGCIGCVCEDGRKGSGITSPSDGIPEGDNFDIDFVAHEIGHQMGANHTWAFNTENTGVNAEPGSGTTIMGYAGITGDNNVQLHSDSYFHYYSIKQILDNLETSPNNCAQTTVISNEPPIANAGNDYNIPPGTAYILKGTATDANGGDALTYCWEQIDNGVVTNTTFGPTLTTGSTNRSLEPNSSPYRYIPKFSRVVAGELTQENPTVNEDWETVSTVSRTLNWALTVRDREPSGLGLGAQTSFDLMRITVENVLPFTANSPGALPSTGEADISWNVGETNNSTINCQKVTIKLSVDNGVTFPFTLATNIDNDGLETITIPGIPPANNARIIVEATDNIFYAMSESFPISNMPTFALSNASGSQVACGVDELIYNLRFSTVNGFAEDTVFTVMGNPPGSTVIFSSSSLNNSEEFTMSVSGLTDVSQGIYNLEVIGTSASVTNSIANIGLEVIDGICNAVANTDFQTSITGVSFNTLENLNNGKPSGYSDFTNLSTAIERANPYGLTVNINTFGNFLCESKVWIDWNQNCIFEGNEEYDLGTATNVVNGPTSNSPLPIVVPIDAVLGNTTMRVSTKFQSPSSACENDFDGEIEDYTVNILPAQLDLDSQTRIYPNPNSGLFNIKLIETPGDEISVLVYDVRGRRVYDKRFQNTLGFNESVNLKDVQGGLYLVRVSNGKEKITRKIIVR